MIKYRTQNENKISIYKNILINNGVANAYYVLFPFNYNLMDSESTGHHIENLYNTINNIYTSVGDLKISLFKLKNIISREDTIDRLVSTIKLYNHDYDHFPEKYASYIKNATRDFSILAIQIETKNAIDIENQNIMEIIKQYFDVFVKENFSTKINNIDPTILDNQNKRFKNVLARYAIPANERLVMNIYINSIFPSYNLIYNDYMVKHSNSILAGVKQEIIPHLGYFELSNSGIVAFGGTPKTTYGSVLTILEFPDSINSENFNIMVDGMHINMHLIPKDKAILKFKQMRAEINEELEESVELDNPDSDTGTYSGMAQHVITDLRHGRIITEVDANILVLADTKEELDEKKKYIISLFSDINVVCTIASDQAKSFVDSFVKNNPNEYYHIMDLQYALSFQIDEGVLVGDQDSNFASPVIGIS